MVVRVELGQFFTPVGTIRPMLHARLRNTARIRMTGERSPETFKQSKYFPGIKEHWLCVHFHISYGLHKVTRKFG